MNSREFISSVPLVTIDSQYDNIMKVRKMDKETNDLFYKIIKEPLIVEDKNLIPQWKFCSVVEGKEKRRSENILNTDVLLLDFDDSRYNRVNFEKMFSEYRFIIHTSHSYDGTNTKFRVILPLHDVYSFEKMFGKCYDKSFSAYDILLNYFQYLDSASLVRAQFFKMPAIRSVGAPYYYKINDTDKLFSLYEIEGFSFAYSLGLEKQKEFNKKREMKYKKKYSGVDLTKAKEYISRESEKLLEGERHLGIFGLACWFKKLGGTFSEFQSITNPSWSDSKFRRQLKRLENEWYSLK